MADSPRSIKFGSAVKLLTVGGDGLRTVSIEEAEVSPPGPFTVIVYLVARVGETLREPLVGTVPILGSIDALVAFVDDHLSMADSPRSIKFGSAVKLLTVGGDGVGGASSLANKMPKMTPMIAPAAAPIAAPSSSSSLVVPKAAPTTAPAVPPITAAFFFPFRPAQLRVPKTSRITTRIVEIAFLIEIPSSFQSNFNLVLYSLQLLLQKHLPKGTHRATPKQKPFSLMGPHNI
jgi:hypothetical protein